LERNSAFKADKAIDPLYSDAWYNKRNALSKLNKYDEAIKAFNKANNSL
jgi:tetratricopeptide (TPR) repeat protein